MYDNLFVDPRVERSSDQVIKPVNLEALSKWVGHIPDDVIRDMADIAPMLSILGYDPYANPPEYGKPDAWVKDNTHKVSVESCCMSCRTCFSLLTHRLLFYPYFIRF